MFTIYHGGNNGVNVTDKEDLMFMLSGMIDDNKHNILITRSGTNVRNTTNYNNQPIDRIGTITMDIPIAPVPGVTIRG